MVDLLKERGAAHIHIFGGGGGVISDREIDELHEYGVSRIFSVEDGRTMGLQGMIDHMLQACDFSTENLDTFRPDELKNRESLDRKSTRLNSSHVAISYAVFCLKKTSTARGR